MTAGAVRTDEYTFANFSELVAEDRKADLLDGVIYMASPENTDSNELFVWLIGIVSGYVEQRDLGDVYGSRVAFRITDKQGPEPDIAFVAKEHRDLRRRGYIDGPPDVAIEIVSPDSVDRDYDIKRRVYEDAGVGVGEYWILDIDEQRGLFLRNEGGQFVEFLPDPEGWIESRVVPGLRLRVEWFWSSPRPSALTVLMSLLESGA